jgi:hypothetical protein
MRKTLRVKHGGDQNQMLQSMIIKLSLIEQKQILDSQRLKSLEDTIKSLKNEIPRAGKRKTRKMKRT